MKIWYLETSAVNKLMSRLSIEDAIATKQFQLNKGRDFRLSPVTIWEILMTSDEVAREKIIYFCQHLFSRELLPSPSELIIPWIEQGMPKTEKPRELVSNTPLAKTWRDLVDNRRKTFIFDYNLLKIKVRVIQSTTKDIHQIIKNGDILISSNEALATLDVSLSSLIKDLPFVKDNKFISNDELLAYKVAYFYILLILCAEGELENEVIKSFWESKGIDSTLDRIFYIVKELPELIRTGPFAMMAYMTIAQSDGKYSRGVWQDSLHSIYLTYVDKLFTNDNHFRGLRQIIPEPTLQSKIHHMDELSFTSHSINTFGTSTTYN